MSAHVVASNTARRNVAIIKHSSIVKVVQLCIRHGPVIQTPWSHKKENDIDIM